MLSWCFKNILTEMQNTRHLLLNTGRVEVIRGDLEEQSVALSGDDMVIYASPLNNLPLLHHDFLLTFAFPGGTNLLAQYSHP